MKFLIFGDPIESLNPAFDTGLLLSHRALSREHEVHWATKEDFFLSANVLFVRSKKIIRTEKGALPQCGALGQLERAKDFDSIWIRKDPPFDQDYLSICWLLGLVEREVLILNKPSILVRYHEKLLAIDALSNGYLQDVDVVPTFMSTGKGFSFSAPFDEQDFVTKPWFGHGGAGVSKHRAGSAVSKEMDPFELVQPFQSDVVKTGDRRAFFLEGRYVGGFLRVPKKGSFISNLVAGGSASVAELSTFESEVISRLEKFLAERDVFIAGADLIGGKISEVNVTAPTGFTKLFELTGRELDEEYLVAVEKRLGTRR